MVFCTGTMDADVGASSGVILRMFSFLQIERVENCLGDRFKALETLCFKESPCVKILVQQLAHYSGSQ